MTWKEALIFLLLAGSIGGGAMWFSVWSCNKLHEALDKKDDAQEDTADEG